MNERRAVFKLNALNSGLDSHSGSKLDPLVGLAAVSIQACCVPEKYSTHTGEQWKQS